MKKPQLKLIVRLRNGGVFLLLRARYLSGCPQKTLQLPSCCRGVGGPRVYSICVCPKGRKCIVTWHVRNFCCGFACCSQILNQLHTSPEWNFISRTLTGLGSKLLCNRLLSVDQRQIFRYTHSSELLFYPNRHKISLCRHS